MSSSDFVSAARSFACGRPEEALMVLMPFGLTEHELHRRVRQLVAVGAVLTGAMRIRRSGADPAGEPVGLLAAPFVEAGARLDDGAIQDLLAAHRAEVLVDVLVELVVRFAREEFLTELSAEMTRRDLLAGVVALAGQAPGLSDDQLRARLVGLTAAQASRLPGLLPEGPGAPKTTTGRQESHDRGV